MLSTSRIAIFAGLMLAAFGMIATLSSGSNGNKVAAAFAGSVEHEGVSSHNFTVSREGTVEVTLTNLRLAPTTKIGMGLGTPTPAGNCALVEAIDSTHVDGRIGGTLQKGTYCVALYDSGAVESEPVEYTVSVTEQ